jgi:hypothetical protein
MRESDSQLAERMARLSALNESCACGHAGWVHTDAGCVGRTGLGIVGAGSGAESDPCECTIKMGEHIATRLGQHA